MARTHARKHPTVYPEWRVRQPVGQSYAVVVLREASLPPTRPATQTQTPMFRWTLGLGCWQCGTAEPRQVQLLELRPSRLLDVLQESPKHPYTHCQTRMVWYRLGWHCRCHAGCRIRKRSSAKPTSRQPTSTSLLPPPQFLHTVSQTGSACSRGPQVEVGDEQWAVIKLG